MVQIQKHQEYVKMTFFFRAGKMLVHLRPSNFLGDTFHDGMNNEKFILVSDDLSGDSYLINTSEVEFVHVEMPAPAESERA